MCTVLFFHLSPTTLVLFDVKKTDIKSATEIQEEHTVEEEKELVKEPIEEVMEEPIKLKISDDLGVKQNATEEGDFHNNKPWIICN